MSNSIAVIPGLPAEFANLPGIVMLPPPPLYRRATERVIEKAVAHITDTGPKGVFTWVATTEGVNLAWVHKHNDHLSIEMYIGRKWGEPISAGIMGKWEY
jgi:hypothetical protein